MNQPWGAEHTVFVRPKRGKWYAKCTCGKVWPLRDTRDEANEDERQHRMEAQ